MLHVWKLFNGRAFFFQWPIFGIDFSKARSRSHGVFLVADFPWLLGNYRGASPWVLCQQTTSRGPFAINLPPQTNPANPLSTRPSYLDNHHPSTTTATANNALFILQDYPSIFHASIPAAVYTCKPRFICVYFRSVITYMHTYIVHERVLCDRIVNCYASTSWPSCLFHLKNIQYVLIEWWRFIYIYVWRQHYWRFDFNQL